MTGGRRDFCSIATRFEGAMANTPKNSTDNMIRLEFDLYGGSDKLPYPHTLPARRVS